MKADYTLGICFDIDDPQNMGRIRAISIGEIGSNSSLKDILNYITLQDNKSKNSSLYLPWYNVKVNGYTQIDPYLCTPFLPKNIGITPNPGQLIKIINYNGLSSPEFVGPYTIDQITLTEEYRNVIRNLQKNIDISEVLPQKGKLFFSGYNTEQLIMGDNEFIMRLSHINDDKTRKDTYPFIQLSQFSNSYNIVSQTVTENITPDVPINYIAELFIDYTPKISNQNEQNIIGTLILYDTTTITNNQNKQGLTKNTYDPFQTYITKDTNSYVIKHQVLTNNMNDFNTIISNIINIYNTSSNVAYYNSSGDTFQSKTDTTKNLTIIINNNLPNLSTAGGGIHDDPTTITGGMRNWLFRLTPGTLTSNYQGSLIQPNITNPTNINVINYNDFVLLDAYITNNKTETDFGQLSINQQTIIVSVQDVPVLNTTPISANIVYSDKFLFLSSLTSPSLIDDTTIDGISSSQISEILFGTNPNTPNYLPTYGFIRGEAMMDLMVDMLTMFQSHGHEAGVDPTASIVASTQQNVSDLITRIQNEKIQGQNNIIINHNLRLN